MSSNAAKEWSGTFKELSTKRDKLKRQIQYHLKTHQQQDTREAGEEDRQKRTEQAIATLEKNSEKINRFLKTQSPRMGQGKRPKEVKRNLTDNESAKMTTSTKSRRSRRGLDPGL